MIKQSSLQKNCTNCQNAIFDETWGEYKCKLGKKDKALVSSLHKCVCGYHKKGTPTLSKN